MAGKKRWQDEPVAWFFLLEKARCENNFARAAEAKENLERLGVKIKYEKLEGVK